MSEQILTLEDINNSETLQSLGAWAGDKVNEGKLVRIFSTEEEKQGEYITQEKINNSKTLQDLGAESGDRVTDGKLIRMDQNSSWKAFSYGKAKGEEEGLTDQGIEILESYYPTAGRIIDYGLETISDNLFPTPFTSLEEKKKLYSKSYQSPDEKYGEGFSEATPGMRREMILREKERNLQKTFGVGYVPKSEAAEIFGTMYGALKDPTTLIPAGGTVKTMMLSGAGLGATYSAIDDMAKSGRESSSFLPSNINIPKAGLFGTVGAAVPGAFAVAPKIVIGSANLYTKKTSQKTVNKAQAIIAKKKTLGINLTEQDMPLIAEELGMSTNRLLSSYKAQKVSPKLYSSTDEAEKALNAAIAEDSSMLRVVSKGADNYLGAISTRLKKIDDGLFGRLMRMEFGTHKSTHLYLERVDPFSQEVAKLPALAKQELNKLLASRNHKGADQWMRQRGYDTMADSFEEVKNVLKEIGDQLPIKADMDGYFPRNVRDHKKFIEALGGNTDEIERALNKAAAAKQKKVSNLTPFERDRVIEKVALGKAGGTGTKTERIKQAVAEAKAAKKAKGFKGTLSKKERTAIVTRVLKGYKPIGDRGLRQTKQRTVKDETLTDELMAQYRSPEESLQSYIRTSVNNIEKRKFFQGSVIDDIDGEGISINSSINKLVKDLKSTSKLDAKQTDELKDIISARFGAEDATMHGILAGVKNLGYIGTLGDFLSTMTQLTDTTNIMGYHGFFNTVKAAFGPKVTKMEDIGISDIARELGESGSFTKTLNTILKASGFKRIDRFGKETLMQAVRNKSMKQLKTDAGVKKFKEKWSDVYGPDIDRVVSDLQNGTKSELSNLHYFTKLSEHQPISYSEYPAAYLRNPNGRLAYMLKSFTLKQYDLVRRNLYQEFKKAEGVKAKSLVAWKTAKVAGFMATGGLAVDKTKDLILGREIKPEDLPMDAVWSLAGAFGLTRYIGEGKLRQGDVLGAGFDLVSVPIPLFKGLQELFSGDTSQAVKHIPVIGRTLHSRGFGGAKKYNKRKRKSGGSNNFGLGGSGNDFGLGSSSNDFGL